MSRTLEELNLVFCDVFRNKALLLSPDSNASTIEGWDSLTQMLLVAAVEKHFGITFTLNEVMGFKNAGDIITTIDASMSKKACR
jgi:acyl carrier protein